MASRFSVEAVFRAVDKISRPLKKIGINSKNFSKTIARDFAKAQRSVKNFAKSIKTKLAQGLRVGFAGAVAAAGLALKGFITQAAKIEDAVAAFTPLLGSAEKANVLVEKLNQTAATTPFQFEAIAATANQLLPVMNGNIENTIETFRMLGDTAGGNVQKLESITRGFTKAMLKGKVDLESLNMIAEAGVPIFDQLANELGVSKAEMFKMVTAGKVTTTALTNTFQTMTSEGGIFFRGMEIASKTFSGKLSTLKDNIVLTAASIGNALLPTVKGFIDRGIEVAGMIRQWANDNQELIKNGFQRFLDVGKKVIVTFGRVAKVIFKILKFLKPIIPIILGAVAAWKVYKAILIVLAIKQALVNTLMNANPIMLVIIGVVALIAAIVLLVKNWDKVAAFLSNVWKRTVDFVVGGIQKLWDKFSGLLDNPFFAAIATLVAPWLTIPALIIKNWEKIKTFFSDLWENTIKPIVEGIQKIGGKIGDFFGGGSDRRAARQERRAERRGGVVTQGDRVSESISESTNRSQITVKNDGTTDVETDSGIVRPGGSVILQPSG